jgi:hypothetical protein
MEQANTSNVPMAESTSYETGSRIVDHFSVVEGGPIYRFQLAIGMALRNRSGLVKRALLTILITWLPLLLLSLAQDRAFGNQVHIPFLYDFATAIRFFIGLPLLVIAEAVIDPKLNHAVKHFVTSGLVAAEDLRAFEEVVLKTNRLRDSVVPALVILIAAFTPSIWYKDTEFLKSGVSTWHTIASLSGEHLSVAGWWFGVVSLPLFRVLLFRWVWMTFLWTFFLRRLVGIELRCVATHADGCGGLGFLTHAQLLFGLIAFANAAVLAGAFGNSIAYQGATVASLKFLMIAYCALAVIVLAAPLLVLTPKLLKVKRRGIYQYGSLGNAYAQAFDAKWIQGISSEREALLGTSDIQSLADLSNSFAVVQRMKVVLINKEILLGLAIPAVLPMVPLIVIATPADELVRALLKVLV